MTASATGGSSLRQDIYRELASIRLVDPHTHINPHSPASTTLADLLGYHYYTELAHSAGMSRSRIEESGIGPKELVGRLVEGLGPLENTAQYSWLIEICRTFFGFEGDRLRADNWESLYDHSESVMSSAQWAQTVLDRSNVAAVFLTNDFDDPLEDFDTQTYIPCLRTDDLVFHLADPKVRGRLESCTGVSLGGALGTLRSALRQRFEHFVGRGARACAISLPPTFSPRRVGDGRATTALDAVLRDGLSADPSHRDALANRVFWTLAELCDEFGLPFDLMIGVNRKVYPDGVHQGQDLYDSRVSLIQYRELFNAFPQVRFPISVLASVTNQELVSYAWIFPNVITNGHWWYSNTPSFIARDAAARLEAVPATKQIGYYSDAYKLEFVWPKFDMYRQVLAGVLAEDFVTGRGWSLERAVELGQRVLRGNVDDIFPPPSPLEESPDATHTIEIGPDEFQTVVDEPVPTPIPSADRSNEGEAVAGVATLAGGAASDSDRLVGGPDTKEDVPESDSADEFDTAVESGVETGPETGNKNGAESSVESGGGPSAEADRSVETPAELDPLPHEDELRELGVDDVEIVDDSQRHVSAETIAAEADDEPLDVGDLWADDPESSDEGGPENDPGNRADRSEDSPAIVQMNSETSFAPDEEDLRLAPDPTTGEWIMPSESGQGEAGGDEENFDFRIAEDDDQPRHD